MMYLKAIIDAHDVSIIMGKSPRAARDYLMKIREHFCKERHHWVTVEEFSEYSGIPIETIYLYLKGTRPEDPRGDDSTD